MEVAPELQFRHHTLAEAQLPAEAFVRIEGIPQDAVALCCDLDAHVFYAEHTDPRVVAALAGTHWIDLREWAASRPAP
jgi:hypothetical protein